MSSAIVHDALFIVFIAWIAFASIGWIPPAGSRARQIGIGVGLLGLWYGFYVAEYLGGETVSDFMLRKPAPAFCNIIPLPLCTARQAADQLREAEKERKFKEAVAS